MVYLRRGTVGLALIGMLAISTITQFSSELQVRAEYQKYMNPGMQMRVEQDTLDALKQAMGKFLPDYINHDLDILPKEFDFEFGLFFEFLTWHFKYTDIKYKQGQFAFDQIKLQLTRGFDQSLLKVDFPAIKSWEMTAQEHVDSWLAPDESPISLIIKDFDLDFHTDFTLDSNGYLDPLVKEVKINFGETKVEHNNFIVGFIIQQILEFGFVIIENSVYFVGGYIFSNMLGPVLDKVFDDYKLDVRLPSPLAGQNTEAQFTLDYRNVRAPYVGDGYMEMYIFGEFLFAGREACQLDPDFMDFINSDKFSQLVISESAMTCILNNFAASPIGRIELDSHRIDQLFIQQDSKFDTNLLKDYIPILYKKLGKNVDLTLVLEFENIKAIFGQYDSDVILEYDVIFQFVNKKTNEVAIKDRFPMISVLDIDTDHDIVYYRLLNFKVDAENLSTKSKSEIDNLGLTATQYREFMSNFSYTLSELKNWLNDSVFKNGMYMPYIVNEFLTNIYFKEKSMHVELEVFPGSVQYFEDTFDTWKN